MFGKNPMTPVKLSVSYDKNTTTDPRQSNCYDRVVKYHEKTIITDNMKRKRIEVIAYHTITFLLPYPCHHISPYT